MSIFIQQNCVKMAKTNSIEFDMDLSVVKIKQPKTAVIFDDELAHIITNGERSVDECDTSSSTTTVTDPKQTEIASITYPLLGGSCGSKKECAMIFACSRFNPSQASTARSNFTPSDASGRFIFTCLDGGNIQEAKNLLVNLNGATPCVMLDGTSLLQHCYELSHLDVFSLVTKYPQWCSDEVMCQELSEKALLEGRFDYVDVLIEHKLSGYPNELMRKLIEKQDTQTLLYIASKWPEVSMLSQINNVEEFKYLKTIDCPIIYHENEDFIRLTCHWTSSDDTNFSLEDIAFIYSHASKAEKETVCMYARNEMYHYREVSSPLDNSDFDDEARFFNDLLILLSKL